ncbi:MAG: hypothetical protein ACKO1N_10290 [Erythrobacter sp.]
MSKRIIFGELEPDGEVLMRFRLTYEGPIFATQRDPIPGQPPKHTENKHQMRMVFHKQLERLWRELPALNGQHNRGYRVLLSGPGGWAQTNSTSADAVAADHKMYGKDFVPLVTDALDLVCDLDILFLRPEKPGAIVWAGDIDNRLKTLLDALRIPEPSEKYAEHEGTPDRIFCLLEDDKLISRVAVETDRLLMPTSENPADHDARVVITVRLAPYSFNITNMEFG